MHKIFSTFKLAFVIAIAGLALSSCGNKSEQVKYIPKDANFVIAVDVKSLATKSLDFKEIFNLENIKKAVSGSDSLSGKIKNSGVDLLSSAYVFGQINGDVKGYGALILPLSDADKFEATLKNESSEFTVTEEGEFKIGTSKAEESIIAVWNKNTAIICGQSAGEKADLKERVLAFYNLKKEESLAENDKNFAALQNETADISFWMSFEKIAELAAKYNPMAAGMNFKETYFSAACNFEDGQIVVNSNYHANKDLAEKLGIGKDNVNKDLVGVVPGKALISMLSMAIDMNKLYAYLEKENLLTNLEESAKMAGVSGKELFAIFSGDLIGTVNGAVMKDVKSMDWTTGEEVMKKEPRPEYALVVGIADQGKGTQLLEALSTKGMIAKKDNYYSVMDEAYIVDKGSYWIVAPESMRQEVMDANGEKLNGDLSTLLAENSGVFYFNFNQVPDEALDFLGASVKNYFKTTPLESITISGTNLKDNTSKGKCVIAFKEKEQNSFITLIKMSGDLAAEQMKSTTTVEAPISEIPVDTAVYAEVE